MDLSNASPLKLRADAYRCSVAIELMSKLILYFVTACLIWAVAVAGDSDRSRRLNLPERPFQYGNDQLPKHFEAVAKRRDNTPPVNPITDHGATLGRVLFYDPVLSVNASISCASCHRQELAFTDAKQFSVGFDGKPVTRNSMSLVNARYYASGRFFWDERAATLEEQVLMPIGNSVEMGHSLNQLVPQLQADPIYAALFQNAFGSDRVSADGIAKALAQFIRSIVSYRSRFDAGRAMVASVDDPFPNFTEQENYGKQQFLHRGGCAKCHLADQASTGEIAHIDDAATVEVSTRSSQRQSAFFYVEAATVNGIDGDLMGADGGVGGYTKDAASFGAFKVSSLRNVELTAPYMHDGRFLTLDRVLEHYNWSVKPHPNLDPRLRDIAANGLALPEREKVALTEFLKTLTDHKLISDPRFADPFEPVAVD